MEFLLLLVSNFISGIAVVFAVENLTAPTNGFPDMIKFTMHKIVVLMIYAMSINIFRLMLPIHLVFSTLLTIAATIVLIKYITQKKMTNVILLYLIMTVFILTIKHAMSFVFIPISWTSVLIGSSDLYSTDFISASFNVYHMALFRSIVYLLAILLFQLVSFKKLYATFVDLLNAAYAIMFSFCVIIFSLLSMDAFWGNVITDFEIAYFAVGLLNLVIFFSASYTLFKCMDSFYLMRKYNDASEFDKEKIDYIYSLDNSMTIEEMWDSLNKFIREREEENHNNGKKEL